MDINLTPELYEIIVALARKAVDDRLQEFAAMRRDLEDLKAVVNRLAEAQAGTEEELRRLAAAQARTEERVDRIEATVAELVKAHAQTQEEVRRLAAAHAQTQEELRRLAAAHAQTQEEVRTLVATQAEMIAEMRDMIRVQRWILDRLGELRGWQVEMRYKERAASYFGSILKRVRVVPWLEIEEQLEARLTEEELQEVARLDLLVTGRPRRETWVSEAWLTVEASGVVDEKDVARARRRARILRSAGLLAIPTVAGESVSDDAWEEAARHHVLVIEDGIPHHWEEALQTALSDMEAPRDQEGPSEASL